MCVCECLCICVVLGLCLLAYTNTLGCMHACVHQHTAHTTNIQHTIYSTTTNNQHTTKIQHICMHACMHGVQVQLKHTYILHVCDVPTKMWQEISSYLTIFYEVNSVLANPIDNVYFSNYMRKLKIQRGGVHFHTRKQAHTTDVKCKIIRAHTHTHLCVAL